MSVHVRDRHGDTLDLVAFDGKTFELVGPRACAPGQPMLLELPLGVGYRLELKSIGSKKRADGRFDIRARPSSLAKGARDALEQAFKQQV